MTKYIIRPAPTLILLKDENIPFFSGKKRELPTHCLFSNLYLALWLLESAGHGLYIWDLAYLIF